MKIALSTHENNLSVAFDFADTLIVFTVENGEIKNKKEFILENNNINLRTAEIKKLDIEVLICGCISRRSYETLSQLGIEVISHISGSIENIISAYLNKTISNQKFSMPGCGRGMGKGFGRGRFCEQNRGFGRGKCRK